MSDPIVGIDLGTSNTVVAHASAAGTVTVLADDAGYKIHPSVVSFHPGGGVIVGAAAKQRKIIDPRNTIYSVKRLIGRSYHAPEVQAARARLPFPIEEGPGGAPVIATRGGRFAVPEISAIVLDHVRAVAAARLERPVDRAVVTVPASFNDAQRAATATAGAIAGLTVVRVLNEPTAAALAYGHGRGRREIIAVYDFGGGTFDVTLLRLDDPVYEVLATSGDTSLGGDDLDDRLVEQMVARFLADHRIDLRDSEVAMMRLRAIAEQTKIELSRRARATVQIDEIAHGPRGAPLDLQIEITRDDFVREIADLVDRTFPVCSEALALAGLSADRVADVLLVGGTTKIPYVREQVGRFFGKPTRTDVNPEDAVAAGAALQATALERGLARRRSSNVGAPTRPAADTASGVTGVVERADPASGASSATPDLATPAPGRARRPTADSAGGDRRPVPEPTRPDTRYSVTRAGVRGEVEGAEHHRTPTLVSPPPPPAPRAASEGATTATHPSHRVGRVAVASAQDRPVFGVPAAPPAVGLDPDRAGHLAGAPRGERPITATGTASPPPIPRPGARPPAATPPPPQAPPAPPPASRTTPGPSPASPPPIRGWPAATPPEWTAADPADEPRPDAWAARPPTTTQPMAPAAPIAPPTAPTRVAAIPDPGGAQAARGIDAAIAAEPSPATTAPGLPPPRHPAPPAYAPAAPPSPAPVLLEVTPRGLGIATVAGFCEALIRRNARLPAEARKLFTTSRDHQDVVRIVVCQGESRRLDHNTVIGDLVLQGLTPRPRGETSIEVTFALDAAGVLQVRARDAQTGAEQRATLALVGDVAREDVAVSRDRLQRLRR